MFIVLEDRPAIALAIVRCFEREGIAAIAVGSIGIESWLRDNCGTDASTVEAVLCGEVENRSAVAALVNWHLQVPVIAILDFRALRHTLELFSIGVGDVVAKPFHVHEILARAAAIRKRSKPAENRLEFEGVTIFSDGRDPLVCGAPLNLPRRERRILEYLLSSHGQRLTKAQIFNRVYGVLNDGIHESVIESHISRLRKRLKERLGYDPIESQRHLGYRFLGRSAQHVRTGADRGAVEHHLAHACRASTVDMPTDSMLRTKELGLVG